MRGCFLVNVLGQGLNATNGKDKKVISADADTASPYALDLRMPAFPSGFSVKAKPRQKEATLITVQDFAATDPKVKGCARVIVVAGRGLHLRHEEGEEDCGRGVHGCHLRLHG